MRLHFEVTSKDRYYLGSAASYTFNNEGGCIGRASSSSWVIEDTNCFISSTHLYVACHSNGFYVTDVSTNGTFRGHQRLKVGVEDSAPLQVGDELILGEVKIRVISIQNPTSSKDITEISSSLSPPSPNSKSHYGSLDELEVLAQQARLADVISQCYPEIDHGQVLMSLEENKQKHKQDEPKHKQEHKQDYKQDNHEKNHENAEILLDSVIKVLFVEIQRQLAVDRIENPSHYESMSRDNIFRQAVSLTEFYSLAISPTSVREDVQEVLRYLVSRSNTIV